jgi:NAD(P)-dependent dehydrogenase (short-subunit alcohol dehydrogenase family)
VRLAGKVVVVTGAGQGQGAAEARLLAAEGARVIGCDLKPEPAECLPGVEYRQLDVTDAAGWAALAAELGRVDGLVANAGITWRARLDELDPADLARVQEVNVTGTLLGIQALTPLMTDGGSVVVVGSVAARTGHFPVAYTASKWVLRGLAKAACLELGPRGIRVNTLSPGYVPTEIQGKMGLGADAVAGFEAQIVATVPLARSGRPEEIAKAALFLASEDSSYVTAVDLQADGGWMNV